jgi:type IV secretory pathway TraG/TraD family ATPase VirD4
MFGSIRSVTGASLTALDYLSTQAGPPVSVREWVRSGRGVLFLPYRADQIAALRSIISAWLRLAIFQTMTEGEGDQRLWFFVDELDALGPIDGLKDALARLRKFGGRCVLGFQSIAQVSSTYGHGEAQTIVENCSNTLILRCSASENGGTARFASRLIGEREVIRPTISRSRRSGLFTDPNHSVSRGEQHVIEAAVLPAEVEQLKDLAGYLKFASHPAWLRIRLDLN